MGDAPFLKYREHKNIFFHRNNSIAVHVVNEHLISMEIQKRLNTLHLDDE